MKKRTILPFIFNSELTHRIANSKVARTTVAVLLGITVACGGISGCDNGEDIVTETETEAETEVVETTVQVIADYDGESIYFELAGTTKEGRVVVGVSLNEVLVRLADGSEMTINVDRIEGILIADHPDIGTEIVMLGDRDKGEETRIGEIEGVYTDGMRKIKLVSVQFIDNTAKKLDVPRIRFVHEDTKFEDGGYLTLDEFADWLD